MSPVRTPVALVPTQLGTALQWFRDPPHQVVSLAKAFVDHSSLSIERPTTIRDPARFEIRTFLISRYLVSHSVLLHGSLFQKTHRRFLIEPTKKAIQK